MDIASTAPAPSISSLKFRLCSFPLWEGPNRLDHPRRESRFASFPPSFQPEVRTGDIPWPLSHPSVQHQPDEGAFPAHSGAAPHPCSSPTFLLSITALLLKIPALKFSSLIHTLISHVQALLLHEEPLMCEFKPASLAGVPRIQCPDPWDMGPAQ